MSESSIISACAKRGSRTPTPFPALEPESSGPAEPISSNLGISDETQKSCGQRTSGNATRWRRSKDTSKGTGILAGGIELTEQNVSRFWQHFARNERTGCLEWTGALFDGYGRFSVSRTIDGVKHTYSFQSHKLAYILCRGTQPDPLCVCHKCDNRKCAEPSHLFVGTRLDNMRDMVAKGRWYWQKRQPEAGSTESVDQGGAQ